MISVTSITVDLLENLCRLGPGSAAFAEYSKLVPNPFTKLLETRTRYPVGALSLGDVDGQPVLATVHRPRTIAFDFLNSGTRASLKLASVPGYDQWVSPLAMSLLQYLICFPATQYLGYKAPFFTETNPRHSCPHWRIRSYGHHTISLRVVRHPPRGC